MGERFCHLVMVTAQNNNKYYDMRSDGVTIKVTYGRIGATNVATATYPDYQWDTKYDEKIRKGYRDETNLVAKPVSVQSEDDGYKPIDDKTVAELVEFLQSCARQVIRKNYTIAVSSVTQTMIDDAQRTINMLANESSVDGFNRELIELFHVLPRAMSKVQGYLANVPADFEKIVSREQDLLDVMRGQVTQQAPVKRKKKTAASKPMTILEEMGLTIEPVSKEDEPGIIKHLGQQKSKYSRAWRVTHAKSREAYEAYMKAHPECKRTMYWHGSKNENWWNSATRS